ncbi:MAG: endonuclease/exonuclease/phosphatase family protein [Mariniblastus sp.]
MLVTQQGITISTIQKTNEDSRSSSESSVEKESQRNPVGSISSVNGWRLRSASAIELVLFYGLIACSVAALLSLDQFPIGMLLTYPPRLVLLLLAALMMFCYLLGRRFMRLTLVALCSLLLIYDLPWQINISALEKPSRSKSEFTLLSFNVENDFKMRDELANFCATNNVDLLSLQEVSAHKRPKFITALQDYYFFWGDSNHNFEHEDRRVFSCMVGIKKSLLPDPNSVEVFTGITGYRTMAIECDIRPDFGAGSRIGSSSNSTIPLRLVNVHTTKPVTIMHGLKVFIADAAAKATRHRQEKTDLDRWLESRDPSATLIAGDFNAPANSYNLKFRNWAIAHRQTGNGPHVTFPRTMPIIGIDHVIGNPEIKFTKYKIVDLGFSDHLGQLVSFQFRKWKMK